MLVSWVTRSYKPQLQAHFSFLSDPAQQLLLLGGARGSTPHVEGFMVHESPVLRPVLGPDQARHGAPMTRGSYCWW